MVQEVEARLGQLQLELAEMQYKALELRVQAAVAANRLVRLDNPILLAKMDALRDAILEQIRQPCDP